MEHIIILIVTISIIFHSIINLRTKFFSKKVLYLFGFSVLVGFAANKDNPSPSFNKILLAIPFCFVAGLAGIFNRELLPSTSERKLHILSLIYLYTLILFSCVSWNIFITLLLISPILFIIYYGLISRKLRNFEKVILYCLNILFLIVIESFNINQIALYALPQKIPITLEWSFIFSIFFLTGILFYIIIYILNIIWIIPIPAKDESNDEMKNRIDYQSILFEEKVSNVQAIPLFTIIYTIIMSLFLYFNVLYSLIPHSYITELFVISILIVPNNFLKKFKTIKPFKIFSQ